MNNALLQRAMAGNESAFAALTDPHRRELQFHCYRMLGSLQDAEDQVQETLLAAWRNLPEFEGRSSLRTWLYRIATNRCLNALRDASRRPAPAARAPFPIPEPTSSSEPTWLEPFPDARLEFLADPTPGPDALYQLRETVELAFIAAAGSLPPRQRAVLILRDVLGYRTSEVAEMLDTTEESVKGALKRARATLAADPGLSEPRTVTLAASPAERDLASRFAHAFKDRDVPGLVALLTDDAWLSMPPSAIAYQGPALIGGFLNALLSFRRPHPGQLVATRANGQVAFGDYVADRPDQPARLAGIMVLTLTPDANSITRIHWFINIADSLAAFGLPPEPA
jgi:RNA polymerase sigma-70 factor (ECF subfamily)